MAIKGGTSGIKYQLPSNAEITARQGAASASAGGSASAAAYGAERRMAGLKNQLRHDAQQSELDRIQQSEENALNREHQERSQLANHLADFTSQGADQKFRAGQSYLGRKHQSSENALGREHQSSESALDREVRERMHVQGLNMQSSIAAQNRLSAQSQQRNALNAQRERDAAERDFRFDYQQRQFENDEINRLSERLNYLNEQLYQSSGYPPLGR